MSAEDGVASHSEKKTLTTKAGLFLFAGGMLAWALFSFLYGRMTGGFEERHISIESQDGCHVLGFSPSSSVQEGGQTILTYWLRPGIYEVAPRTGVGKAARMVVYGGDMYVKMTSEGCQTALSPLLYGEEETGLALRRKGEAETAITSQ